jgi:hypothetical protein
MLPPLQSWGLMVLLLLLLEMQTMVLPLAPLPVA